MAGDHVEVMAALRFERFAVVSHDRGGRVGHRMALDHRDRGERLAVLDIVPTWNMFNDVDKGIATDYFHWFFLIQADDFPERLIGADLEFYIRSRMRQHNTGAAFLPTRRSTNISAVSRPKPSMPAARITAPPPASIWPMTRRICRGP